MSHFIIGESIKNKKWCREKSVDRERKIQMSGNMLLEFSRVADLKSKSLCLSKREVNRRTSFYLGVLTLFPVKVLT